MVINFRTRLLLLIATCIAAALLVVVLAIVVATKQSITVHTERELVVSERVLTQVINYRDEQLRQAANVLADDFGFRQAIVSEDEDTIVSALTNHAQRLNADLVMLLDPQQRTLIASHDMTIDERARLTSYMEFDGAAENAQGAVMVLAEGELFQVVWVPIRAPHLLGWLTLGFAVDRALAEQLQQLTNSYVHFVVGRNTPQPVVISSANEQVQQTLQDAINSGELELFYTAEEKAGRWIVLGESGADATGYPIDILLTASKSAAAAPFTQLRTQLLMIVILTLLTTVVITLIASRRFVQPLRNLANVSDAIAQGRYNQRIPHQGRDEIGVLALALDSMQNAIADREQEIWFQSQHDILTGLPNQRAFHDLAEQRLRRNEVWTVVVLNLDNFRRLNEMFGRSVCDAILVAFAERLQRLTAENFTLFRLQGDEFVLTYAGTSAHAEVELRPLLVRASEAVVVADVSYAITLSAGAAEAPRHAQSRDELIRLAQFARNKAKRAKNHFADYCDGEDKPYLRTLAISAAIPQALESQRFSLVYQPQIDGRSGKTISVEVLIRWHDPDLGFVSPAEFIPLAEQSGTIFAITRWVLHSSIQQLARWQTLQPGLQLSVNLSASDLMEPQLLDEVFGALAAADVQAHLLTVEVTESAVISEPEKALAQLNKLRAAGVKVAIDDYGTGYSSLAQLRDMPATELKVDRSFIMNLPKHMGDQTIVQSTIQMAHQLGLKVVAEGVEDEASAELLRQYQCDVFQGYWYSRPISEADLTAWLQQNNPKGNV